MLVLAKSTARNIEKFENLIWEINLMDPKLNMEVIDVPVFDYAAMSERLMDDQELIQVIADAYLSDMPVQIEQLKTLVQNEDVEQAAAQAHKIKGASSNVGAMALSALALKMEQAGKAGDMDSISQNVTALEQCFEQLKSTMEETLS